MGDTNSLERGVIGTRSVRGGHVRLFIIAISLASAMARPAVAQTDPPRLRILGAQGSESQIKRLASTADVTETLVIESTVDEQVAVTVRVGPFIDPKGISVMPTVALEGKSVLEATIPPHASVSLSIAAYLSAEAEYTSEITLVHSAKPLLARLVVLRAAEALPVSFLPLETVRADADFIGDSSAHFVVELEETSGRAVSLETFVLRSFTAKDGSAKYQARAELAVDPGARDPKTNHVSLAALATVRVPLVVRGLAGAGEYTGTIRISAPGMKPVDKPFTLVLRESRWTAFAWILSGALLSVGLHFAVTKLRPRLLAERRLEVVARQLRQRIGDPSIDEAERALLRELRDAVQALFDAVTSGDTANPDDAIAVLEKKRELADVWIQRSRQVKGIEPSEARDEVTPILRDARDALASSSATVETLRARRTELDGLPSKADAAVKHALDKRIAAMRDEVDAAIRDPARALGPAASERVVPLLEKARSSLIDSHLEAALVAYKEARTGWLELLLDALEALANADTPAGFDSAGWRAAVGPIVSDVNMARELVGKDSDAALRRYRGAQARYLASIADGFERVIDKTEGEVNRSPLDEPRRLAAVAGLKEARDKVREARRAIAVKLEDASRHLAEAEARWKEARSAVMPKMQGAAEVAAIVRLVPAMPSDVSGLGEGGRAPILFERAPKRRSWIWVIDLVATLVAIAVAVLLGINVLWTSDPTWGGWQDYTAAALWGLGLQGVTFSGVAALGEKLYGKRTEI